MTAQIMAQANVSSIHLRPGKPGDVPSLLALERAAFSTDHLSPRSFRRFLGSPSAVLLVAEYGVRLCGYALVLFRPSSKVARLYSIAVMSAMSGRGIGPMLLAAAEESARRHKCATLRLEVHEHNAAAIRRYQKSGYRLFGRRPEYYDDGGNALRFEKHLDSSSTGHKDSASPAASVAR
jgi:[ribosomal protein S18]-alanine N-acetyltransferase